MNTLDLLPLHYCTLRTPPLSLAQPCTSPVPTATDFSGPRSAWLAISAHTPYSPWYEVLVIFAREGQTSYNTRTMVERHKKQVQNSVMEKGFFIPWTRNFWVLYYQVAWAKPGFKVYLEFHFVGHLNQTFGLSRSMQYPLSFQTSGVVFIEPRT